MAVVQSEGAFVAAHKPSTSILRGLELYSGNTESYGELFLRQPNVRIVNGFLARNIAQLGLHAYERVSDTERRRLDPAHELSRLIRRPNPYTTRYAFVNAMILDLGIYDVFAALKVRNPETGSLRLFRIPPYLFEPIGDSWIAPAGIRLLGNKARPEFTREQIVYMHGYHPTDPRAGASPLEALRRTLAEEAAASQWREQLFRRGARISGVIERPADAPKWSDTARARFRSDWQALYAGAGELSGANPVLEEGMTWKAASFSSHDVEYLAARRLSREEVAAAYFVSPLFVGILDHANFSNVAEQHKHLYQDTLGPRLVEVEEELEAQVLPDFADLDPDKTYLEFNLAEKLKGTFEEQAAVIQTMVGAPVMSRNEGRARLNLAPIAGGDDLVTPLNVLVGGQASPRDSAPTSGAAGRGRPLKAIDRPAASIAARGARQAKAVEDLPSDVVGWHAKHVEVLGAFFDRQKAAVTSRLGAGQTVDEAWDDHRWDGELEADLFALSATMTAELAAAVADRFGGEYDEGVALGYLRESARIAAENVNAATKAAVAEAWARGTGFAARTKDLNPLDDAGDDDEVDPLEEVAGVFALAAGSRAVEIATTRATAVGNFARHEGARQSGVPSKVWRVNSARPRDGHPADGETVGLDDTFSNGARWPGDPGAGVDQSAGCSCSLDFSTEDP